MNITPRKAVLLAAEQIEREPESYEFLASSKPNPKCGSPGCVLGWIGYYMDLPVEMINNILWFKGGLDAVAQSIGVDSEGDFYDLMEDATRSEELAGLSWRDYPEVAVKALRLFADQMYGEDEC